jgi:hypothetical protein
MKARHIVFFLVVAGLVAWTLISCDVGAVSIADRISSFQDDLNTSSRSNLYKDFHPTETTEYPALANPSAIAGFNTLFPVPGTAYSLSVVDSSNSNAVIVQVAAGPTGGLYTPPGFYLRLKMDTTGTKDNRIVTLDASLSQGGGYTNYIF